MIERNLSKRCQLWGTIALILLQSTNAIINETFNGYLFTTPDQPDNNWMTKDNANKWCKDNKNKLLEIYDSQLQETVIQFINRKSEQNTYLGIRQIFTNGMRTSAGACLWVNGQEYRTSGLEIKNQQNLDNAYVYLVLNQSGIFYIADSPISNKRGYICEDSSLSTCKDGFTHGNKCYRSTISSEQLSWFDTRNRCLGGGGDLASFDFVNDYQSLYSLNGSWIIPSTPYWIGLRREFWKWQESAIDPGSEIKYTNWQNGHPRPPSQSIRLPSNCLCLTTSQQRDWSECDCNEQSQFICATRISNDGSTSTATALSSSRSTPSILSHAPSITSTSYSTFAVLHASSTVKSSSESGNSTSATPKSLAVPLGVGLGVGLGGLLIIVIIIIVVVVLIRKRGSRKFGNSPVQRRLHTPDILKIEQEDKYATVERKLDYDGVDLKANDMKTIYAVVQPTTNQTVL